MKGSLTYVPQNRKKRPGLEQRHTEPKLCLAQEDSTRS
jgi:hypothetical protein